MGGEFGRKVSLVFFKINAGCLSLLLDARLGALSKAEFSFAGFGRGVILAKRHFSTRLRLADQLYMQIGVYENTRALYSE